MTAYRDSGHPCHLDAAALYLATALDAGQMWYSRGHLWTRDGGVIVSVSQDDAGAWQVETAAGLDDPETAIDGASLFDTLQAWHVESFG